MGDKIRLLGFFVVDELARKLGDTIWRYKITVWNEQAEKLNMEKNINYRFTQYKMKYNTNLKKAIQDKENLKCI